MLFGTVTIDGQFHHARWIILWLPFALAVGGLALSMIWRISHRLVIGLSIGAIVLLAGAVGMEMLNSSLRFESESEVAATQDRLLQHASSGASIPEAGDNERIKDGMPYTIGTTVEELLEMLGVVVWIAVILQHGLEENRPEKSVEYVSKSLRH